MYISERCYYVNRLWHSHTCLDGFGMGEGRVCHDAIDILVLLLLF